MERNLYPTLPTDGTPFLEDCSVSPPRRWMGQGFLGRVTTSSMSAPPLGLRPPLRVRSPRGSDCPLCFVCYLGFERSKTPSVAPGSPFLCPRSGHVTTPPGTPTTLVGPYSPTLESGEPDAQPDSRPGRVPSSKGRGRPGTSPDLNRSSVPRPGFGSLSAGIFRRRQPRTVRAGLRTRVWERTGRERADPSRAAAGTYSVSWRRWKARLSSKVRRRRRRRRRWRRSRRAREGRVLGGYLFRDSYKRLLKPSKYAGVSLGDRKGPFTRPGTPLPSTCPSPADEVPRWLPRHRRPAGPCPRRVGRRYTPVVLSTPVSLSTPVLLSTRRFLVNTGTPNLYQGTGGYETLVSVRVDLGTSRPTHSPPPVGGPRSGPHPNNVWIGVYVCVTRPTPGWGWGLFHPTSLLLLESLFVDPPSIPDPLGGERGSLPRSWGPRRTFRTRYGASVVG